MTTNYTVLTPYGTFDATWREDEDVLVQYSGNQEAIDFFKDFLDVEMVTGAGGRRLNFNSLEPSDMYGFCQSEKYGIVVMPSAEDLLDTIRANK